MWRFPAERDSRLLNPLRYKISWYWPYAVLTNVGSSKILKDGEIVEAPHLSDPEEVEFPESIGKVEAFTTGVLQDVVEHLGLTDVKDAWAKTLRWPGHCEIWRKLIELHLLDDDPLEVKGCKVSPRDVFLALGEKTLQYAPGEGDSICQRVEISLKDRSRASYTYEFMDFYDFENDISAMARTTAFPCSITALMIARGDLKTRGVIHPIKIGYDDKASDKFFKELAKRNIRITERFSKFFN